jgi:hypothetical protein
VTVGDFLATAITVPVVARFGVAIDRGPLPLVRDDDDDDRLGLGEGDTGFINHVCTHEPTQ